MKKTDSFQTSTPETVTISRAEYEELQAQSRRVSELEGRMNVLMEALRLAQRKRFGASSEKSEDTLSEQLSFLFNEAEVFAEEQRNKEDVTVVAAHKRHKKHEYTLDKIPEDVPVEQVEHRLEGQELVCPQCGGELLFVDEPGEIDIGLPPMRWRADGDWKRSYQQDENHSRTGGCGTAYLLQLCLPAL